METSILILQALAKSFVEGYPQLRGDWLYWFKMIEENMFILGLCGAGKHIIYKLKRL